MSDHYLYNPARREIRPAGLMEWANSYEARTDDPTARPDVWAGWWRVGYEERDGKKVSTVFLGLNHEWDKSKTPVLYETMIFGLPDVAEWQERYSTIEEAEAGHVAACRVAWPALEPQPAPEPIDGPVHEPGSEREP